jgi:hypothetical protein
MDVYNVVGILGRKALEQNDEDGTVWREGCTKLSVYTLPGPRDTIMAICCPNGKSCVIRANKSCVLFV